MAKPKKETPEQKLRKQLKETRAQVRKFPGLLKAMEADKDRWRERVESNDQAREGLKQRLDEAMAELGEERGKTEQLRAANSDLQSQLAEKTDGAEALKQSLYSAAHVSEEHRKNLARAEELIQKLAAEANELREKAAELTTANAKLEARAGGIQMELARANDDLKFVTKVRDWLARFVKERVACEVKDMMEGLEKEDRRLLEAAVRALDAAVKVVLEDITQRKVQEDEVDALLAAAEGPEVIESKKTEYRPIEDLLPAGSKPVAIEPDGSIRELKKDGTTAAAEEAPTEGDQPQS